MKRAFLNFVLLLGCLSAFAQTVSVSFPAINLNQCLDSIQLTPNVTGGSGNYSYSWTPTSGLSCTTCPSPWAFGDTNSPVAYQVLVEDLTSGDLDSATLTGGPILPALHASSITDTVCPVWGQLWINALATGGVRPYSILWSNGSIAPFLSNPSPGNYSVTITDVNGCADTESVYVNNGNLFNIDSVIKLPPSCNGSNGSINIFASGGTPPYFFTHNGDTVSMPYTNLKKGSYSIYVYDASGFCPVFTSNSLQDSCGKVTGTVFKDDNGNGVRDTLEEGLAGAIITSSASNDIAVSNVDGFYSLSLSGTTIMDVLVQNSPDAWLCNAQANVSYSQTFPSNNASHSVSVGLLQTLPNIDFGFLAPTNPCGVISGTVFDDNNSNGVFDAGDMGLSNVQVISSEGFFTLTGFNGAYALDATFNTQVTVSVNVSSVSYFPYCGNSVATSPVLTSPVSGSYSYTTTAANPDTSGNDFAIETSSYYNVGVYSLGGLGIGVSGEETFNAWSDIKRLGDFSTACCYRITYDPAFAFVNSSYPQTSVGANYVEWCFPASSNFNFTCLQLTFRWNNTLPPGTQVAWTGEWTCDTPDPCTNDNIISRTITVPARNKRLQNDGTQRMLVFNESKQYTYELEPTDTTFSYEIYFMNTTGRTVYCASVIDTLSPHLDISTITTPFSSEAYDFYIREDSILVWDFENIWLPDTSEDFANSYGFIQYNIQAKNNLPPGTLIKNKASVRLNLGTQVTTNTVENRIKMEPDTIDGVLIQQVESFNIYPNPNSGQFVVEFSETIAAQKLTVYNSQGQVVKQLTADELQGNALIDLGIQANGLYLVQLQTEAGSITKRVVVSQ